MDSQAVLVTLDQTGYQEHFHRRHSVGTFLGTFPITITISSVSYIFRPCHKCPPGAPGAPGPQGIPGIHQICPGEKCTYNLNLQAVKVKRVEMVNRARMV